MALRKDLRVMVVDDMSVSRQLLQQMLEHIGISDVRLAPNAQVALNDLGRHPADIVISDQNMPGTSGLDFLKELRQTDRTRDVRFIMTSGTDSGNWIDEAQAYRMDRFLPKPFDMGRLVRCLESIAGRI